MFECCTCNELIFSTKTSKLYALHNVIEDACANATTVQDCAFSLAYAILHDKTSNVTIAFNEVARSIFSQLTTISTEAMGWQFSDVKPWWVVVAVLAYYFVYVYILPVVHFFRHIVRYIYIIAVAPIKLLRRKEQTLPFSAKRFRAKAQGRFMAEAQMMTSDNMNTTSFETKAEKIVDKPLDAKQDKINDISLPLPLVTQNVRTRLAPNSIGHPPTHDQCYEIANYTYTTSDPQWTTHHIRVPSALYEEPNFRALWQKYLYLHYDIEFFLNVNAPLNTIGTIAMAWKPGVDNALADHQTVGMYFENLEHVAVRLGKYQNVSMVIPYGGLGSYDSASLYTDRSGVAMPTHEILPRMPDWGNLMITLQMPMVVASGTTTSTYVTVLYQLRNLKVYQEKPYALLQSHSSEIKQIRHVYHSPTIFIENRIPRETAVHRISLRDNIITESTLAERKPFAQMFDNVVNNTISEMKNSTLPIDMKGDDLNLKFGGMALDLPSDTTNPIRVLTTSMQKLNHSTGYMDVHRCSLLGKDQNLIDPACIQTVDEASLEFFKKKFSTLTTFSMSASTARGALLKTFPLSPIPYAPSRTTLVHAILARMCTYWNGGLKYKIRVSAPPASAGTLFVGFFYGTHVSEGATRISAVPDNLYSSLQSGLDKFKLLNMPGKFIELNDEHDEHIFEVSYVAPFNALYTTRNLHKKIPGTNTSHWFNDLNSMGTMALYCAAPLARSNAAPSEINIQVSYSFGDDFALTNFGPIDTIAYVESTISRIAQPTAHPSMHNDFFTNLRQYWMRFHHVNTVLLNHPVASYRMPYHALISYLPLANLYAGSVGAVRLALRVVNPGTAKGMVVRTYSHFNDSPPAEDTAPPNASLGVHNVESTAGSNTAYHGLYDAGRSTGPHTKVLTDNGIERYYNSEYNTAGGTGGYTVNFDGMTSQNEVWFSFDQDKEKILEIPIFTPFNYTPHVAIPYPATADSVGYYVTYFELQFAAIGSITTPPSISISVAAADGWRPVLFSAGLNDSYIRAVVTESHTNECVEINALDNIDNNGVPRA